MRRAGGQAGRQADDKLRDSSVYRGGPHYSLSAAVSERSELRLNDRIGGEEGGGRPSREHEGGK